ncbi:response regulator [Desulfosoma sp.]
MEKNDTAPATVMVVDDTPANLRYLQLLLKEKGYRVVVFPEGSAALRAAAKKPPDIILLDILMPHMDGFEVCRRLKADPVLGKIPVLFITALTDGDHKLRGFEAGGVDYVTKPFEEREVLSRVETHLRLYRLSQHLESMVERRTVQLAESNRALREEIAVRKEAQRQLEKQQALLQSVFDGMAEPLLLVDQSMYVKLFNKAASVYFETLGRDLTAGKKLCHICDRADPQASDACQLPECVAKGEGVTLERKGLADASRIELVSLYPVVEHGCKTGDVIMRIADVTEERRIAAEMAHADKLISLGTVAAGVAHDINNPNHTIMLNAATLSDIWNAVVPILDNYCDANGDFPVGALSYRGLKKEVPELLEDIQSCAGRINRIVAVLKNFAAKRESPILMASNVNEAVKNACLLLKHRIRERTRRFEVSYGQDLPVIKADSGKLEQVFVNLIANALEALPDPHSGVFVHTAFDENQKEVLFVVRDEGMGIPEEDISRITDLFFTTKRDSGGTGLGLAIAKQIIDLHGGRLEVESTLGRGSTFRVALPAFLPEEPQEKGVTS